MQSITKDTLYTPYNKNRVALATNKKIRYSVPTKDISILRIQDIFFIQI